MKTYVAERRTRRVLLERERYRQSSSHDDRQLKVSWQTLIYDQEAQMLASYIADNLDTRLAYIYEPIESINVHKSWDDCTDIERKRHREERRALIFHASALFDVNECSLDWFPMIAEKSDYVKFLSYLIFEEISRMLGDEFDSSTHNTSNFLSIHKQMMSHLEGMGRKDPNYCLKWWSNVENATVPELLSSKLYLAPLFTDGARAFLSIQSSSAQVERLFSVSENYEGARRHHGESAIQEMLFSIKSYVTERSASSSGQTLFLSRKVQAIEKIAQEISVQLKNRAQLIFEFTNGNIMSEYCDL